MPRKLGQAAKVEGLNPDGAIRTASHIDYKHSEVINGDIQSGSNISCGGDLLVNGVIEDSRVTVKGDLFCDYGFIGVGRGVIEAGGNVHICHIKNQTIIASGGVNIATEAVNSTIGARRSINANIVIGGTLSADRNIIVKTVGNTHGVQTTLQINPNIESQNELAQAQAAILQHEFDIERLVQTLETLPLDKKEDEAYMYQLKNSIITAKYKLTATEAKLQEIESEMDKLDNSFIHIERCAYPGTIIIFGQKSITLADTINGRSTLRMVESQIKIF